MLRRGKSNLCHFRCLRVTENFDYDSVSLGLLGTVLFSGCVCSVFGNGLSTCIPRVACLAV